MTGYSVVLVTIHSPAALVMTLLMVVLVMIFSMVALETILCLQDLGMIACSVKAAMTG